MEIIKIPTSQGYYEDLKRQFLKLRITSGILCTVRTQSTFSSVQSLSCVRLFVAPWTSAQGFPVQHQLLELTQTHVHQVGDAIQPSHPLSSPSPPTFNLSQHCGLFKWVSSLYQVAKSIGASASASVPPVNIQDWFPLGWTGWASLLSKGLSRIFSNTTVQKR